MVVRSHPKGITPNLGIEVYKVAQTRTFNSFFGTAFEAAFPAAENVWPKKRSIRTLPSVRYNTGVKRKIVSLLTAWLLVGLFFVAPSPGFAQTDQSDVTLYGCTVQASWDGGSLGPITLDPRTADDTNGSSDTIGFATSEDARIPLDTPIRWRVTVDAEGIRCNMDARNGVYAQLREGTGLFSGDDTFTRQSPRLDQSQCLSDSRERSTKVFLYTGTIEYDDIFDYNPEDICTADQIASEDPYCTRLSDLRNPNDIYWEVKLTDINWTPVGDCDSCADDSQVCRITLNLPDDLAAYQDEEIGNGLIGGDFDLCSQALGQSDLCEQCRSRDGIWTAVGCIPTRPVNMVQTVMGIGLSLAGGVCLLMILAAGFTFSTSQGDPKKTGQAKEMMTSAIVGLVFILMSVTILQFIGVGLLGIPGFGTT